MKEKLITCPSGIQVCVRYIHLLKKCYKTSAPKRAGDSLSILALKTYHESREQKQNLMICVSRIFINHTKPYNSTYK